MVITLFGQYGLACIEEWNDIESLLLESKYHFEMMEFYQDVLNKN